MRIARIISIVGLKILVWCFYGSGTEMAAEKIVKCQENMEFLRLIELAAQFENSGDFNDAITCFRSAVKIRPYSADALVHFSDLLIRAGKNSQALNIMTDAFKSFHSRKSHVYEIDELSQLESALARTFEANGRDNEAEVKHVRIAEVLPRKPKPS
jgi:tetratricopeptide (TPR) repeat protein